MFFRVLGILVVQDGEPSVPLLVPGAKERALLGRLLVSPSRAVPVDVLVADLWESGAPPSARRSLQAHVVRLRTALEPERPKGSPGRFVVRRGDGYVLAVPAEAVDSSCASAQAGVGRAALAVGDPGRARVVLRAAEGLWRGEPFVDWRDALWAQAERQRLRGLRATVVQARLDAELALGLHREVVADLEGLVVEEPLHEGWWVRLMLALYRCDRQADALAAGRRARSLLAEELGVDAGPALRRMEQAILDQSEVLEVAGPPPALELHPAKVPLSRERTDARLTTFGATDAAASTAGRRSFGRWCDGP
jgi:DNA-binding SARP family transcriptional activator